MKSRISSIRLISATGKQFNIKVVREPSHLILLYSRRVGFLNLFNKWEFLDSCNHESFVESTLCKHFGFSSKLLKKAKTEKVLSNK